ncbi:MAG: bifunctional DNA-formamidopyrimidine glycosylase/DNA-(apurinic or apyrimidinic site) lyase [Ancrocorticia sp.]|nr:bifunctional DNA-formamidopyrimidine glycosylase/DNA-(apurinic or apyrimidinic site) lyase [Ancrocorticia sp.]
MPELPEVESVRRGLATHLLGRRITAVQTYGERVIRYAPHGLEPVVGGTVTAIGRRGKFLWFDFGRQALVAHLGMSGQFRLNCEELPHVRAHITFDDGTLLDFVDQRTFGYLAPDDYRADGEEKVPCRVCHIARDLLDPQCELPFLVQKMKAKRTQIKRVLLDQTVVSGIGNIYADEALFAAGIHPASFACDLTELQLTVLYCEAKAVLCRALEAGGTSFDALYVHVNGESGYFDRELRAYGRTGLPCLRCGAIMQRTVVAGRSSVFCPQCQVFNESEGTFGAGCGKI